jgi:hypothetical protein
MDRLRDDVGEVVGRGERAHEDGNRSLITWHIQDDCAGLEPDRDFHRARQAW